MGLNVKHLLSEDGLYGWRGSEVNYLQNQHFHGQLVN